MTEFQSIRELYDAVVTDNSVSYDTFRHKLQRLSQDNLRTVNNLSRSLGVEPTPSEHKSGKSKHARARIQFVAYDGEGWDDKYVLLANSLDERVSDPAGLSTLACLEFLSRRYDKPYKRVFFSFSYDINHIIRDFSDADIEIIIRGESVIYQGYRVSYIPGKIFIVNGFRYYDVFSFFATSFINVVKQMLGPERVTADLIEGKSGRGTFETWNLDKIIKYN